MAALSPLTEKAQPTDAQPTDCRQAARVAYALSHWRSDPRTLLLRGCPPGGYIRRAKARFYLWRAYRRVAPFRGFHEGDPFLRYLAVPRYIVECETRGSHGVGRWLARNPSGAQGPAQLMPIHAAPNPARTGAQKVRYWHIVHGLYRDYGSAPWECAA